VTSRQFVSTIVHSPDPIGPQIADSPGPVPAADPSYTCVVVVHKEIQEDENKDPPGKVDFRSSRSVVPKTIVFGTLLQGALTG
jgi:hypothetical protein